jgi:TonB family protein
MRLRFPSRTAALTCALLLTASQAAAAQLVPPRPSRIGAAADPRPDGPAPRASVELELELDREGAVIGVKVTQSAGDALDAAATDAARAFTFEPATRDGVPIPARIRYEVVFTAREAPPAPPIPPEGPPPPPSPSAPDAAPPVADPDAFSATARTEAPSREVTKQSMTSDELGRVAGTRGDPLLGVQLMPGVSRGGNGGNGPGDPNPILRGANTFDSQVFLEGAPAPLLYHVGGFTSFVHSRVLDSVDLYPSNFSVRYGRKVGGIIEARVRDPRTDGFHGIAEASLLDTSLLVETPIGEKLSVLAAARRSNIDAFLGLLTDSADTGITASPVYWDFQTIVAYKPTDQDRLRLLAYASSDRFALVLKEPADVDPLIRGTFEDTTVFERVQLGYRHRWHGGSEQNTELTYGHSDSQSSFGSIGHANFVINTIQGRSEWTGVVSPAFRVVAGLDLLGNHFSGGYSGPPLTTGEGDQPLNLSTQARTGINVSTWVLLPGAYVEAGLRPFPELLVTPGIRADYSDLIQQGSLDPRLSARLDVTDNTVIKAGIGRFSQPPNEAQSVDPIGNPNLRMTHALHTSAGIEQKFGTSVTGSVEGFAKWIDGMVAGTPDGRAPFFDNSQSGRVFGGELLLRVRPTGRFFGFASYTLMRSERRDDGQGWRLFDRDQTHVVAATGVYRLGRGWEVGATLRYTSGAPYTPVTSSTYDATTDTYQPRLGPTMSARNPPFSRLDLRVQKTWTFSQWRLAVYADVQNSLNSPNREGFSYNYDYSQRQGTRGLPILPILGIRGEL